MADRNDGGGAERFMAEDRTYRDSGPVGITGTMENPLSVVVYGPPGSGKTRNKEELRRHFKMKHIVDEAEWEGDDFLHSNTLYLAQRPPAHQSGVMIVPIEIALRQLEEAERDPVTGMTPNEVARSLSAKDTNPKDAVGVAKVPQSVVSRLVLGELGLAMFEGARKYGRHNYRVAGVRASVYFDALNRHMDAWWEGEDLDPDSGLSHVTKAIATLVVLRDAMIQDKFTDDRPPPAKNAAWMAELNKLAADLIRKYPDAKPAITRLTHSE